MSDATKTRWVKVTSGQNKAWGNMGAQVAFRAGGVDYLLCEVNPGEGMVMIDDAKTEVRGTPTYFWRHTNMIRFWPVADREGELVGMVPLTEAQQAEERAHHM